MNEYDKFILCYEIEDFRQCAEMVHHFIDEQTYQGVHLPSDWIVNIENLLKMLHSDGYLLSNYQEFVALCNRIHKAILEGPGNPSVNN